MLVKKSVSYVNVYWLYFFNELIFLNVSRFISNTVSIDRCNLHRQMLSGVLLSFKGVKGSRDLSQRNTTPNTEVALETWKTLQTITVLESSLFPRGCLSPSLQTTLTACEPRGDSALSP